MAMCFMVVLSLADPRSTVTSDLYFSVDNSGGGMNRIARSARAGVRRGDSPFTPFRSERQRVYTYIPRRDAPSRTGQHD
jgi:hypothetical protein